MILAYKNAALLKTPQMDIDQFVAHYLGLTFSAEFFNLTRVVNNFVTKHKRSEKWSTIEKQVNRHLADKTKFRDICKIFHQFINCSGKSHEFENFITFFCLTDIVYEHTQSSCFPSVAKEIHKEVKEILVHYTKNKFENLSNILTLVEFHNERAL